MSLKKTLATLLLGVAIAAGGTLLARQVVAAAAEADAERLQHAILGYITDRNPGAPVERLRPFPAILLAEAGRADLDHCLVLAQAQVESDFRPDAVGRSGEIGLFQMLPSTAAGLEPVAGKLRSRADLADPVVSTRFALAYLREIRARKPALPDAFAEYNGGPGRRHRRYYGRVMDVYVEMLERPELRCRFRAAPRPQPLLALLGPA